MRPSVIVAALAIGFPTFVVAYTPLVPLVYQEFRDPPSNAKFKVVTKHTGKRIYECETVKFLSDLDLHIQWGPSWRDPPSRLQVFEDENCQGHALDLDNVSTDQFGRLLEDDHFEAKKTGKAWGSVRFVSTESLLQKKYEALREEQDEKRRRKIYDERREARMNTHHSL